MVWQNGVCNTTSKEYNIFHTFYDDRIIVDLNNLERLILERVVQIDKVGTSFIYSIEDCFTLCLKEYSFDVGFLVVLAHEYNTDRKVIRVMNKMYSLN